MTESEPTAGGDDRITMRFLSRPHDAAAGGASVAAGSVMEWIDQAGYACAVGWSGHYCVTAYVGNVHHARPIAPGSLIAVHARIVLTGTSSMHVAVTVEAADVRDRRFVASSTCVLVFVAIGEDGRPAGVPSWTPVSDSDVELSRAAEDRRGPRAEIKKAMLSQVYTEDSAAPRTTLRFLAPPSAVNFGGAAHGGTVMRWIDEAGYACAASWSSDRTVAVYSGGIHFLSPVKIGSLVDLHARIIHTGPHSMHISVRVLTADPRTPDERVLTTQCTAIYVDPGPYGALPVRQWRAELPEDVRLEHHALDLVRYRAALLPIDPTVSLSA